MSTSSFQFGPESLEFALQSVHCTGRWLVALSGGADSTALLLALSEIDLQPGQSLAAIHVNHGYHEQALEWEQHCQVLCDRLDVALQISAVKPGISGKKGPEAELRQHRYAFFEQALATGDVLLLAHHLEDQAETVLLNLMRGSGIEGLSGMPGQRALGEGMLARPLLAFSRQALLDYLHEKDGHWVEDPGNLDVTLDRNFIRHEVMPLIRSRWPAADQVMNRTAGHMRETSRLMKKWVTPGITKALRSPNILNLNELPSLEPEVLKVHLRHWLQEMGTPSVPGVRLNEFVSQLLNARPDSSVELCWSGHRLRLFEGRLWFDSDDEQNSIQAIKWNGAGCLELGSLSGTLCLEPEPEPAPSEHWLVTSRETAASFRACPGAPSRTVKELLRQARIPPWLRCCVPVLTRAGEILAIGDWIFSEELQFWLNEHECKLVWKPLEPSLKLVHSELHGELEAVESKPSVG